MCRLIQFPACARSTQDRIASPNTTEDDRARAFNSFCNQVCDDMIADQVSKEAAETLIALYLRDHMGEK